MYSVTTNAQTLEKKRYLVIQIERKVNTNLGKFRLQMKRPKIIRY